MAKKTDIAWTDSTFNPWWGCQKVGPGCDHCYAETLDHRTGGAHWGPGVERRRTKIRNWNEPVRWNKASFYECTCCGWRGNESDKEFSHPSNGCTHDLVPARQRVFCASMADVFDNAVPVQWRIDLMKLIAATPNLDWLILTKRIGNAAAMLEEACRGATDGRTGWSDNVLPNVFLGATIVNQVEADRDIVKLLAVPAAIRFLSMEPLLGPVELTGHEYSLALGLSEGIDWLTGRTSQYSSIFGGSTSPWLDRDDYDFPKDHRDPRIHWVSVGGERSIVARIIQIAWVRSLRDQCKQASVPFLFKQWGDWGPDFEGAMTCESCGVTKFDSCAKNNDCSRCGTTTWLAADKPLDSMRLVGAQHSGRLLDGVLHNEFPATSTRMPGLSDDLAVKAQ